ncbi:MAG TPA: pseudouridine synthase [Balneolales bacterium]|nr:pseudouridine synthase [Balneolales bacterium]
MRPGKSNRSRSRADQGRNRKKNSERKPSKKTIGEPRKDSKGPMRLNKYIAHSGICSRREADTLISEGKVKVNDQTITELGYKVDPSAKIEVSGFEIKPEPFVYLLLHKQHDTITTTSDEKGRNTVVDLVEDVVGKRIYPVGRLDRNTTGALLLTNDGELAHRLMHPSYRIGKIYEVQTEQPLSDEDLKSLKAGVQLEDGPAKAYSVRRRPDRSDIIQIGVHEGRYHMVRRMMEAVGTQAVALKRIRYANLTLKGLRSGRWRYLKKDEVDQIRKMVKLKELRNIQKS